MSINILRARSTVQQMQQKYNQIFHSCGCGMSYNHRASLFNHKKSCIYTEEAIELVKKDSDKVDAVFSHRKEIKFYFYRIIHYTIRRIFNFVEYNE